MDSVNGYAQYTLASGRVVKLKFGNGAAEIYAKLMGFKTIKEVDESLVMPIIDVDVEGQTIKAPSMTVDFLTAIRMWVYSAAKFVCLIEGTPIDFTEWDAAAWIEEIGSNELFAPVAPASEQEDKKKEGKKGAKKPLIRATQ